MPRTVNPVPPVEQARPETAATPEPRATTVSPEGRAPRGSRAEPHLEEMACLEQRGNVAETGTTVVTYVALS